MIERATSAILAIILALLIIDPARAQSASSSFYAPPVTVLFTNTSTSYLDQDNLRTYLLIQNTGAQNITCRFGAVQTGSEGIVIVAGGNYEPIVAPKNSVWCKTGSSTSAGTIQWGR